MARRARAGRAEPNPARRPVAVEAFLEMLVAERGASTNTIAAYGRDLDHFATFLDSRGVEVDAADGQSISDYLAELAPRGRSARAGARRLSAVPQVQPVPLA